MTYRNMKDFCLTALLFMGLSFPMMAQDDMYSVSDRNKPGLAQVEPEKNYSHIVVAEGDPLILLQEKKTAQYEIDYSQLMVTDSKDHDYDLNYKDWMISQDEDENKWLIDWEEKDSAECNRAFRDSFNHEISHGLKLSKLGKDYKVILRLKLIDFGPAVKYHVILGIMGGEARVDGSLEVKDLRTDEHLLTIDFSELKGESSYKEL